MRPLPVSILVSICRRPQAKVTAATVSWCGDLPADERKARVRELRALAHMLAPQSSLVAALPAAETGDQVALAVALAELARLPRRRILATYAALRCPEPGKS
jgi:hypothetical protein